MIRGPDIAADAAGFPIVTWTEQRGPGSPAGSGEVRMECRIAKDAATGELMFVARGRMARRPFEAGRPWASLISFGYHPALQRYLTPQAQAMRDHLLSKTKAGKILAGDGGKALLAEVSRDDYFDVSCPEAAQPDLDRLHLVLTREFVAKREALVDERCTIAYLWPKSDDRVETYDPTRQTWPGEKPPSRLLDVLVWGLTVLIVAGIGMSALWLLGLL